MRIAFVSPSDPMDANTWSGTPHAMLQALRRRGHEVVTIGPLHIPFAPLLLAARKLYALLSGRFYPVERNPLVAASYARQVARQLQGQSFDLIFSPSSLPCAALAGDCPVVFWADATFAGMAGYYPGPFSRMSRLGLAHGNALEQRAITSAALCLYASDWAAQSALADYRADPAKVRVIRFGANLESPPDHAEVEAAIAARNAAYCNLLFIGVDWQRKGGDMLLAIARELVSRGLPVRVHVVGCTPPGRMPEYVVTHGFLSKSCGAELRRLHELMLATHYLVAPGRAECFGIVFSEASAYGIPSLAHSTGGVASAISDGVNGHIFPPDAGPQAFADHIGREFNDPPVYRAAALRARQHYETCLNWDVAIGEFERAVSELPSANFPASRAAAE